MSLPVILLHGWGLHGGIWNEVASRLDNRAVAQPELPGYGTVATVTPYDAAGLADALAAGHPGRRVVVGWSMGGMAALAWAARHPDQVAGLVLVATNPAFVSRADWPHGLAPEVLAGFAEALASDYRGTLLRFLSLQARGGDDARATVGRLRETVFARGEPAPGVLADGLALLRAVDLRAEASRIACPTLVLHGEHDNLCPAGAAAWLAEAIPDARLACHPRAAHAPFLSHPDWFVTQLRGFLDELET
ncbi:pimeloyl-[acyl-carrier protein] methyl ester esterase [Parasulfuritortus cantonensis]|uniref:Pimeloyl-[acyl-carrier protein] methyl ester esterase n=1 Tax=Parasulfuritortus cantonensis TaxID=2528202 RepID=A0A4R1BLE1_9PROT|nr:pimeloyl-ACP methyl ester esterase BioH [Parasulfuritortus cantonensis]TCJ18166.1 pimeloyl-[acyl-carrier protein] methyl ester esterase [Parasulfuritortus cantonensis]